MKTLYLDIFSGISGDMFLGAMIDLGVDAGALQRGLEKLKLEGWKLRVARGQKANISGVKVDVQLAHETIHEHTHADGTTHSHAHPHHHDDHEHRDTHGAHGGPLVTTSLGQVELSVFETNVPPRFRLYFQDVKGNAIAPPAAQTITLETIRPEKRRQRFKFKRHAAYLEATTELPEPHEFKAVLKLQRGTRTEKRETQFVEDHQHHHRHEPHHDSPDARGGHDQGHGRNFAQIQALIQQSALSDWVKEKSLAVFQRIAVAEGKIHGLPPEDVHFHEVGAVDSIVDIVGAAIAMELLGTPRVLAGPVVEGSGFINCAHGRFPLPAPATLAILGARGIGVTQSEEPHELVTPTGAALLAEFVEHFGPMESVVAGQIGYGLGTRDNQTRPNVLRAVLGEMNHSTLPIQRHNWETDTVVVVETNLDDINAEILGHFVDRAFAAGALDVFHTPIQMKKNRPGILLTVLCASADADKFSELMLRETSAFGVRRYTAERRKLRRAFATVKTVHGEVTVKVGTLDGETVHIAPEFESCKKLAGQSGVSLKEIYLAALKSMPNLK
jgi:uncharacterized protein (TIGR00299 family) protein